MAVETEVRNMIVEAVPVRRIAKIYASVEFIAGMFSWAAGRQGDGREFHFRVESTPLPNDAKIVSVAYEPNRRAFAVTFEHPSFRPIPPNGEVPELPPIVFRTLTCART